jgi:hypothetical protein
VIIDFLLLNLYENSWKLDIAITEWYILIKKFRFFMVCLWIVKNLFTSYEDPSSKANFDFKKVITLKSLKEYI